MNENQKYENNETRVAEGDDDKKEDEKSEEENSSLEKQNPTTMQTETQESNVQDKMSIVKEGQANASSDDSNSKQPQQIGEMPSKPVTKENVEITQHSQTNKAEEQKINPEQSSAYKTENKGEQVKTLSNDLKRITTEKGDQEKTPEERERPAKQRHEFFKINMENHLIMSKKHLNFNMKLKFSIMIVKYIRNTAKELSAKIDREQKIDNDSLKLFCRLVDAQRQIDSSQIGLLRAEKKTRAK